MKPNHFPLALLCTALLAGCSSGGAGGSATPGKDALQVGVVFDSGGIGDKSFNDSAWRGIEKAKAELGVTAKNVESKSPKDYEGNLTAMADQAMDIVIAVGITQYDGLKAAATANPDTKFAFVDGELGMPNVKGLIFREEQGSFLAGYAAGLVTKTKKIGFVGGMDIPSIKKFEVGYIAGARMANPSVQVLPAKYTGSWDDVSFGKAAAKTLFNQGADIVYHAAGRCGLGVIDAAEEAGKGKFAIGVDSDQDDVAPGYVLTSMVKHVDQAVFETIRDVQEGKFTAETKTYDLANGGIGLTDFRHTRDVIGEANIAKLDEVKQQIIDGTIPVPKTVEELRAFKAP